MLGKIEVQFICEFTAYGESFGLYLLYTVYGTYYTYLFFWLNIYSLGSSWITKFLNDDLLVVLMDTHTHTHHTRTHTHTHTPTGFKRCGSQGEEAGPFAPRYATQTKIGLAGGE